MPFGFSPAPYYCSGWSAEFYRRIRHAHVILHGRPGTSPAKLPSRLGSIKDIYDPCGILFNSAKDAIGQRFVFLGIRFNTAAMPLFFEP